MSQKALGTWASARLTKSALARTRGSLRFQGSPLAVPGAVIAVHGLGPRFDGPAFLGGVLHEIRDGNWITTATVGLDPAWFATKPDVSAPRAGAQLPAVSGLQIGTVKQIEADPAGEFRVLVQVPALDPAGAGLWARLAGPYATARAGFCFRPEVGDEVVLAFLDSDPRFPVILGSLPSSSRPPPVVPDAVNTTKTLVTPSGLQLAFDDAKKTVSVATPAGQRLVLSDETQSIALTDRHGNTLTLSAAGITLASAGQLTLRAAHNIVVEASGSLALKGASGLTASGLSVSLVADTSLSARGAATAELSSSGSTAVKGAMVMIN